MLAAAARTFEHPLPPPALDPPRHERRGRKSGKGGKKKAWEDEAVRIAVKAQAYTAKALRSMGSRQVPHLVTKWFGANDDFTRSEVSGILNGVHRLLSNVNYVFPGEDCTPSTYAYVYPSPPWNKNMRGRYVFHLCDLYMNTIEGDKIETLTHEVSPKRNYNGDYRYTDDVCAKGKEEDGSCKDGKVAYGRWTCEKLAREYPEEAVKNADSYCFFINDVALKSGGGPVLPDSIDGVPGPTLTVVFLDDDGGKKILRLRHTREVTKLADSDPTAPGEPEILEFSNFLKVMDGCGWGGTALGRAWIFKSYVGLHQKKLLNDSSRFQIAVLPRMLNVTLRESEENGLLLPPELQKPLRAASSEVRAFAGDPELQSGKALRFGKLLIRPQDVIMWDSKAAQVLECFRGRSGFSVLTLRLQLLQTKAWGSVWQITDRRTLLPLSPSADIDVPTFTKRLGMTISCLH
ncbi:hypothetical protein AK812_SmicGene7193 [Symbiodinium microadriaticum]|uniref:Lysine-specific metallo-endopeptidase domain-containing protein n=1 Tax=Symbiodinium microadriaticum TaxID=2951 RepID=A0A1Q9EP62_SYMMI|nr:hypothetical protein AK812_SmicGene7193 [Symbiodinium microadriaticum]